MRKFLMMSVAAAAISAAAPALAGDGMWDAKSDGDWMVRLRGIAVVPDEDSDLSGGVGTAKIDTAIVPELDITYFFTKNIAAELILATANHEVSTTTGLDVGDVWLLPPTLTLQYHLTELGAIKPYIGAGVNYTIFYNEDAGQFSDVEYDNSFGFALQAGVDFEVAEGIYLNADVKKIWLDTDINVQNGASTGDVDIDPWIFGLGVGYRF